MRFTCKTLMLTGLLIAVTGCTSSQQLPSMSSANEAPEEHRGSTTPVYVMPNCQIHAGVRHCQWIEPRGYWPAEGGENGSSEQDIAL